MDEQQANTSKRIDPVKESESSQIHARLYALAEDFDNVLTDMEDRLLGILSSSPDDGKAAGIPVAPPRPPLFYNLHEMAWRIEEQLSRLRALSRRITL